MSFNLRAIPMALLALASACGADDVGIKTGCYGEGCPDQDAGQPDATLAPCPNGTVLTNGYDCVSQITGYSPVDDVIPGTWSAAEQSCASSAGSASSIVTTPCDGMVAFTPAVTSPGDPLECLVYDAISGTPVAVISPPVPGSGGYAIYSGDVTITAACFIALTTGSPCSSFDASADAVSD
jgi:hypothetical protein